jgi:hypothetical protein
MGIAASLFFSSGENCLDWRVRPSDEQYDTQKERWNDLAEHLRTDLAQRADCPIRWWLQGSYKFGTQVRPAAKGQEFDIDLGIYFQWDGKPTDGMHEPTTLKNFVHESISAYVGDEDNDAQHVGDPRLRCCRVHFKDDFHIDVPAYHHDQARDARALATQDGWEDSDPKAIYSWWKETLSETERPRGRRIVRYLKMWAALNFEEDKRPSSILLTVLTAKAYTAIDLSSLSGDDEVFRAVIAEILNQLGRSRTVENPANKKEDLNRLSDEAGDVFLAKLGELLAIADKALSATSKKLSAETWSDAFGHFFPVPEVDEEIRQLKAESRALFPHV